MKTAVIGAGAIGSLFASLIKANNADAVLFDKDAGKISTIKRDGLELVYPDSEKKIRVFPGTAASFDQIKGFDYYLLCVKSYSTEAAAAELSEIYSRNSVIATFQNGMGNVEILKKYFPESNIAAGTTSEGAFFKAPSTVIYGGRGKTALSIIEKDTDNSMLMPLLDLFNRCGIISCITDDYKKDIWKKLTVNAAINPLTAALGLQNRYVSESPYLRDLADMIIKESVKAAEKDNIYLDPDEMRKTVFTIAEKTGRNRSSMLQDIENRRKTEIDYISGTAAEKAESAGFNPSVNRIMQNIIQVLEKQ